MSQMEYNAELVWSGVSECTELPIGQFTDKINKVLIISQSGAGASYSDPSLANLGIGFSNLECGSAYLIYSKQDGLPYELPGTISSSTIDNGRIDLSVANLSESFTISSIPSSSVNGTYNLTTSFFDNKPIYKSNNNWFATYNGSEENWILKNSLWESGW